MFAQNTEETSIFWHITQNPVHNRHTKIFPLIDYGERIGLCIPALNNIVLSVLWLIERKQQNKSCFRIALSLRLKVLSSAWYLLLMKQYIVLCKCYFESLFIFFENYQSIIVCEQCTEAPGTHSPVADVTGSDATACIMVMQVERADNKFCKTKL